jgi:hypothetical protein
MCHQPQYLWFPCIRHPQNTHNGDQIEVAGSAYVVQAVVLQFKLVGPWSFLQFCCPVGIALVGTPTSLGSASLATVVASILATPQTGRRPAVCAAQDRGKYRRDHARLEVQSTGRWMANMYLEDVFQLEAPPEVEGGGGGGSSSPP